MMFWGGSVGHRHLSPERDARERTRRWRRESVRTECWFGSLPLSALDGLFLVALRSAPSSAGRNKRDQRLLLGREVVEAEGSGGGGGEAVGFWSRGVGDPGFGAVCFLGLQRGRHVNCRGAGPVAVPGQLIARSCLVRGAALCGSGDGCRRVCAHGAGLAGGSRRPVA